MKRSKYQQIKNSEKNELVGPLFFSRIGYMKYSMMLLILPAPPDPSIDAHDGIIKIYACFANQSLFKTQVDIKNGIDETDGINKNIFFPAEPYTCYTSKYSNVFYEAGGFHPFYKGL